MNCDLARKELSLFLYGELSFDEEELLEQHLEACESCRQELSREKALHEAMDLQEVTPRAGLLEACRQELHSRIGRPEAARMRRAAFWEWLRGALHPGFAYLRPAGALALVALGFFTARLTTWPISGSRSLSTPSDVVASRVRYVQPDSSGLVRIGVEETKQRVLSGRLEDESIRNLLLAAAKDPSDPGLRVESMDILKARPGSVEVRRALLSALERDPNAGVRLKALEGLKAFAGEPETRNTLAEVLLTDKNPGVRTQAIDLLIQHQEEGMVGVLQELLRKEDNNYVRLRCQKALREMNASLETF